MLSQLVVLFTLLVIRAHSEQVECDVVPFETNEVRGSCCIYAKNNFNRPTIEEVNRQLQGKFSERRIQPIAETTPRNSRRQYEQTPSYDTTGSRRRNIPVTENVNSYDTNSRNVPFIDRNRPVKTNPVRHQEQPSYMNSGTRDYSRNNQPRVNEGYNPRLDDNPTRSYNTKSERQHSGIEENEYPESRNMERTYPRVEKPKIQEKADRSIYQSRNGSLYNSINTTGEENLHEKNPKPEDASVPDIGNRNNVNVPDTCTKGFAKKNGKCVEIFT